MKLTESKLLRPAPTTAEFWTEQRAAHLLRRVGFRPAMHEITEAVSAGLTATVERAMVGGAESQRMVDLDSLADTIAARNVITELAGWSLARMAHTNHPLRSRMALFWHNHFATSHAKVHKSDLMLAQWRLLESRALGRFDHLLDGIARDAAMIIWLDGDENTKGRPNENFARELLELFTLGVGHYSEQDIREVARAFTGWHQRRGAFAFRDHEHDGGEKSILGRSGNFNGADVIPLLLEQPAAALFLSAKLLREFVNDCPAEEEIAAFAGVLRRTEFDLAASLRVLFSSELMFTPRHIQSRISAPVEFVVGAVRSLEMRVDMRAAARACGDMGQRLFEPPTVKGWSGGREWINSTTMLVRMNEAARLARDGERVHLEPASLCNRYGVHSAADVVPFVARLLLDGDVPTALQRELEGITAAGLGRDDAMRVAVRLAVGSPEFQLV